MIDVVYPLYINFEKVTVPWEISDGTRTFRIDSFKQPGREFEMLRYQGRDCLTFRLRLTAYTNTQKDDLNDLVQLIVPPRAGTIGLGMPKPNIININWKPMSDQGMTKFVPKSDGGFLQPSKPGEAPSMSWWVEWVQWVAWVQPGLLQFVDANVNNGLGAYQQPNTNAGGAPTVATLGALVTGPTSAPASPPGAGSPGVVVHR